MAFCALSLVLPLRTNHSQLAVYEYVTQPRRDSDSHLQTCPAATYSKSVQAERRESVLRSQGCEAAGCCAAAYLQLKHRAAAQSGVLVSLRCV